MMYIAALNGVENCSWPIAPESPPGSYPRWVFLLFELLRIHANLLGYVLQIYNVHLFQFFVALKAVLSTEFMGYCLRTKYCTNPHRYRQHQDSTSVLVIHRVALTAQQWLRLLLLTTDSLGRPVSLTLTSRATRAPVPLQQRLVASGGSAFESSAPTCR